MASGGVTASCAVAFSIVGECTERLIPGLCRPDNGQLYTFNIVAAMINAEPAPMGSTGTEPAGAATRGDTGHVSMVAAAHDSPGSPPAQANGGAASAAGQGQRSSWAEAAQPGSVPGEPEAPATVSSAGVAPSVGIGGVAAGLSLEGLSLSDVSTGDVGADGSPPVAFLASSAAAEHGTAHGALGSWDAIDDIGGKEQTSSAQSRSDMPRSAAAAGAAAAVDSAGTSLPEMVFLPAALAAPHEDAPESEESHDSSEGAATAPGSKLNTSQAVSGEPLTAQQHAVVAALMVVMKRAMLEGHEAFSAAKTRLLNNDWHTVVILQFIRDAEELPSIKDIEQRLRRVDQTMVDMLALQCTAAGFPPLHVFTKSAQCGAKAACRAVHSRVLARHQQVAELDRVFEEYSFPATWGKDNVDLLVQQGVHEPMATLTTVLLLLLTELCKRCFRPSDDWQTGAGEYAALDHLFPGICPSCITM